MPYAGGGGGAGLFHYGFYQLGFFQDIFWPYECPPQSKMLLPGWHLVYAPSATDSAGRAAAGGGGPPHGPLASGGGGDGEKFHLSFSILAFPMLVKVAFWARNQLHGGSGGRWGPGPRRCESGRAAIASSERPVAQPRGICHMLVGAVGRGFSIMGFINWVFSRISFGHIPHNRKCSCLAGILSMRLQPPLAPAALRHA